MYLLVSKDPRGGHNKIFVNQNFFQIWSPDMAYVLGFIFADGTIEDVRKSSRTCYLGISSINKDILVKIQSVMDSQHKLYITPPKLLTYSTGQYLSATKYTLRIGSKTIYNDLLRLGVTPRKSLTIPFPQVPPKLLPFFIRGYFDGDGCLHLKNKKYPIVIFTSGSLAFLEKLSKKLSESLNIPQQKIYTQQMEHNPCYRLLYNPSSSLQVLKFMYNHLKQSPFLERKYQIYQKYLASKTTQAILSQS